MESVFSFGVLPSKYSGSVAGLQFLLRRNAEPLFYPVKVVFRADCVMRKLIVIFSMG